MALHIHTTKPKELPRTEKPTEHGRLCEVGRKWVLRTLSQKGGEMSLAFTEVGTSRGREMPDVYAFDTHGESTVLEIKTSRSDFNADKSKPFRANPDQGMGDFRYYMCPKGLIKESDLAGTKWGLIWVYPSGMCKVIRGKATKATCKPEWIASWRFTKNQKAEDTLNRMLLLRASYNMDLSGFIDGIKAKSKLDGAIMSGCPIAKTINAVARAGLLDELRTVMDLYGYSRVQKLQRLVIRRTNRGRTKGLLRNRARV